MITPFANDSESMQIGELIIENQQDKVIIYGDIDIYRNEQGLDYVKRLHELTGKMLQSLQQLPSLDGRSDNGEQAVIQDESAETQQNKNSAIDNPFL